MFNSPTAQDVFANNKQNLFGQFGMDPKGNNESGAWARRDQQLTGAGLTNATDYAVNTLEPARQNNLNFLVSQNQPGNLAAKTQRDVTGMLNRGSALGDQQAKSAAARGYSPEFAQAIRAIIQSGAQRNANAYAGAENQRQNENALALNSLIQQGQQNPFLQQFMALAQLIEQRHQQNQAEKAQGGLGGLFGSLGQIASMIPMGGSLSPLQMALKNGSITAPDATNPFYR